MNGEFGAGDHDERLKSFQDALGELEKSIPGISRTEWPAPGFVDTRLS